MCYEWGYIAGYSETWLEVRLSTTIGELKKMKIFDAGRRKCPPHSFTLRDAVTGRELEDDDTLASIQPNRNGDRWLNFSSCSYNIQWEEESPHSQFKTFLNKDVRYGCYWSKVITEELGPRKSQRKKIPMVLPGSTIEYF